MRLWGSWKDWGTAKKFTPPTNQKVFAPMEMAHTMYAREKLSTRLVN